MLFLFTLKFEPPNLPLFSLTLSLLIPIHFNVRLLVSPIFLVVEVPVCTVRPTSVVGISKLTYCELIVTELNPVFLGLSTNCAYVVLQLEFLML